MHKNQNGLRLISSTANHESAEVLPHPSTVEHITTDRLAIPRVVVGNVVYGPRLKAGEAPIKQPETVGAPSGLLEPPLESPAPFPIKRNAVELEMGPPIGLAANIKQGVAVAGKLLGLIRGRIDWSDYISSTPHRPSKK